MIRKLLAATALSASLLTATPALAAPQSDGLLCIVFEANINGTPVLVIQCVPFAPAVAGAAAS